MANEELDQVEELEEIDEISEDPDTDDAVLEATDDGDTEELVEFQASGEASSVPDPINVGSSRRKADKNNGMPMEKLGKTGVIAKVVDAFSGMSMGQASKAYKGLMDSSGNKSSIKAKGNAKGKTKGKQKAKAKAKARAEAAAGAMAHIQPCDVNVTGRVAPIPRETAAEPKQVLFNADHTFIHIE